MCLSKRQPSNNKQQPRQRQNQKSHTTFFSYITVPFRRLSNQSLPRSIHLSETKQLAGAEAAECVLHLTPLCCHQKLPPISGSVAAAGIGAFKSGGGANGGGGDSAFLVAEQASVPASAKQEPRGDREPPSSSSSSSPGDERSGKKGRPSRYGGGGCCRR